MTILLHPLEAFGDFVKVTVGALARLADRPAHLGTFVGDGLAGCLAVVDDDFAELDDAVAQVFLDVADFLVDFVDLLADGDDAVAQVFLGIVDVLVDLVNVLVDFGDLLADGDDAVAQVFLGLGHLHRGHLGFQGNPVEHEIRDDNHRDQGDADGRQHLGPSEATAGVGVDDDLLTLALLGRLLRRTALPRRTDGGQGRQHRTLSHLNVDRTASGARGVGGLTRSVAVIAVHVDSWKCPMQTGWLPLMERKITLTTHFSQTLGRKSNRCHSPPTPGQPAWE